MHSEVVSCLSIIFLFFFIGKLVVIRLLIYYFQSFSIAAISNTFQFSLFSRAQQCTFHVLCAHILCFYVKRFIQTRWRPSAYNMRTVWKSDDDDENRKKNRTEWKKSHSNGVKQFSMQWKIKNKNKIASKSFRFGTGFFFFHFQIEWRSYFLETVLFVWKLNIFILMKVRLESRAEMVVVNGYW